MDTVIVSQGQRLVGRVRFNPLTDEFDPDPDVPADVVSDIVVTYYRDNVLFGRNGDEYAWAETEQSQRVRCPACGRLT